METCIKPDLHIIIQGTYGEEQVIQNGVRDVESGI